MKQLLLQQLSFAYGRHKVLSGVDAEVKASEFIALLGPNGAGKSTLLRLLAGYLQPTTGTLLLDHKPLTDLKGFCRAQQIATVGQNLWIEMPLTVAEIVAMGRYPYVRHLAAFGAADHEAVDRALKICGLEDLRHRRYQALSGGQRQLCLMARAIAQQSPLLLLDEPTAHLDVRHTVEILRALLQLNRRQQQAITIIMASHDFNLVHSYASRVWLLKEGKKIYDGSPSDVLTEKNLTTIFDCPVRLRPGAADSPPHITPLL